MENLSPDFLQERIHDLLYASIRAYNLMEDDAVSLRTLKLMLVAKVLEGLGLEWNYIVDLYKTHTPVHPEIAKEFKRIGDEEVDCAVAQMFVRNEKLVRLLKVLEQHEVNMNKILAVDGLAGSLHHGPNFERKLYVTNLRYGNRGDPKSCFDLDPEYKRLHVQTVREMYDMLGDAPAPAKQIYEILRASFEEMARVRLPYIEFLEDETMDARLQGRCGAFYMRAMGKENIESVVKGLKRFRGEKRTETERELETPAPSEKMTEL